MFKNWHIKEKTRIAYLIILFAISGCNRPLPDSKLIDQNQYLDIHDALEKPTDVYMLTINNSDQRLDLNELLPLKKLQRLDISCKINMDTFPGQLTSFQNLQWIKIRNNDIHVIDYRIQQFKYLEVLELQNNEIKEFPIWLCSKDNKYFKIDLSNNKIIGISRNISNLKTLDQLNLANNQIENLPLEIGELKDLTTLDLTNNKITELPYTISNLYPNLERLFIGGNNISEEHLAWLKKHLPYTDIDANIYDK
ncbi:leucine-rich repeat domain-containing protein [Mariniphaga sediminis]|uniref:Leucine-rich repeat domain-containing protein n=1 Tax=Mariniphaga sediminis TaxID=1628158 RepID=A0A399D8D1_9BACT|nr:leucine-rich repeat domain-containing protein [Mariniphaga sediminis]RIH67278.1 leucine-rich repeat domain-containing protein [Mariniphaga sediminis]